MPAAIAVESYSTKPLHNVARDFPGIIMTSSSPDSTTPPLGALPPEWWGRYGEALEEYRALLADETDRGRAIVGAAYLEEQLGDMLLVYFRVGRVARILVGRSLRGLHARIEAAHSLYLIGDSGREQLHIIRRIRNEFAHDPRVKSFEDAAVRKLAPRLWATRLLTNQGTLEFPVAAAYEITYAMCLSEIQWGRVRLAPAIAPGNFVNPMAGPMIADPSEGDGSQVSK